MKRIILLLTGILFLFTMSVSSPAFAQGGPGQGPEPSYDQGPGTKPHHEKKHKKHHKKHKKHRKHHKPQTANPA